MEILLIDNFTKIPLEKIDSTLRDNMVLNVTLSDCNEQPEIKSTEIKINEKNNRKFDFVSCDGIADDFFKGKDLNGYDYIIWHVGRKDELFNYKDELKLIEEKELKSKIIFVSAGGWPKAEDIIEMIYPGSKELKEKEKAKTITKEEQKNLNAINELKTPYNNCPPWDLIFNILMQSNANELLKIINEKQISMISGTIILPTIIDCYGISKCDEKKRNDYLKEAFGTDNIEKCKTKIEEVLKGYIDFKDIKGKNNIKELCDAVVEAYKNMNLEKKTE